MKKLVIIFIAMAASLTSFGQGADSNKTDAKGKQGRWVKSDKSNILIYRGQFKDDKPYGEFKYYYDTGELKIVSVFSNNGSVSRTKMFFTNGKMMAEGKYLDQKKDSLWKYYSEMEQKLLKEEWYVKGSKNGTFKTYNDSGAVIKSETWKMDVLNGPIQEWYGKDHPKMTGNYVNGVLDGKTVYYFPEGTISASGVFIKGIKDGVWNYAFNSKKAGSQEVYKNGVMIKRIPTNGEFEESYPKSNIPKNSITYLNGKKNGPFIEYYELGQWTKQVVPAHDDYPEDVEEVFVGQKIKRSGKYKNDQLDGKIVYYKVDGTIEKTEVYVDGILQK